MWKPPKPAKIKILATGKETEEFVLCVDESVLLPDGHDMTRYQRKEYEVLVWQRFDEVKAP